jgi:tetratricopeptide (TPR) repeat protein
MLFSRTSISIFALVIAVSSLSVAPSAWAADGDQCADAATPALHIFACTATIEDNASDSEKVEIAYVNRGLAYFATENFSKAIADFDHAVALAPRDLSAYEARAIAFASERDYTHAIADDRKAIDIDPLSTRAYNNLANAYKAEGHLQDALASYDRAIELSPNEPTLYFNRGNTLRALGRAKDAIHDYDYAIALNGKFLNAYIARGNTRAASLDFKNAEADFDRVLAIDPMNNAAIANKLAIEKLRERQFRAPLGQSIATMTK